MHFLDIDKARCCADGVLKGVQDDVLDGKLDGELDGESDGDLGAAGRIIAILMQLY